MIEYTQGDEKILEKLVTHAAVEFCAEPSEICDAGINNQA
jgi:hypothetical protein